MTRDGKNIMVDQKGVLSVEARKLIGGLCEYADSLTAFGNTVASSYLRLVPNHEAPTKIFWSDLNRSALIRVPLGWAGIENLANRINPQEKKNLLDQESRQTVELRSADGSALISLMLAGIAMAADWGFENVKSLDLAKARYGSPEMSRDDEFLKSLPSLPSSCVQSSRILQEKRSLYERNGIFPPAIIDYMIHLLQAEKDDSLSSEWERLKEKERVIQVRKIMHRDLHKH
jgi:glutamine synthetase